MELQPLKAMLVMGKEKLNELLAPARAKMIKAKADLEMAKLEEQILGKEGAVQELFASFTEEKKVDFPKLMDMLDEIEILKGRQAQYEIVLQQLFPTGA